MSAFAAYWAERYGAVPPVGYLMRAAGVANWSRFHSLPRSKRYPETAAERRILLDRQNALARAVLGEGGPCWLVQACWTTPAGDAGPGNDGAFRESRAHGLGRAFSFVEDPGDAGAAPWDAMAGLVRWEPGAFDATLLRIAEERAAPTLWAAVDSGAVFAPYDGGVDLFLPSREMTGGIRTRYAAWRSPHPSGL